MRLSSIVMAAAAGAGLNYFLDPNSGARRRNMARDRVMATLRRGGRKAESAATYASSEVQGAAARTAAAIREEEPPPNDQALAAKVETVIFRDADAPKGQVSVDAAGRTVSLRGQLDSQEEIDALVKQAEEVPEVERVENLLHLPKTPAPTRTDSPASQRKTRRTKGTGTARKRTPAGKVNTERQAVRGEPTPRQAAAKGEGRKPAPMGSSGDEADESGASTPESGGGEAPEAAEPSSASAGKASAGKGSAEKATAPKGGKGPGT